MSHTDFVKRVIWSVENWWGFFEILEFNSVGGGLGAQRREINNCTHSISIVYVHEALKPSWILIHQKQNKPDLGIVPVYANAGMNC